MRFQEMHPDWGPGVAWATAIVTAALVGAQNFRSVTGKGGLGQVDGRQVALGSQALFLELGIELGEVVQRAEGLRRDGQTVLFVAVDNRPAGLLGVADPIKPSTPEALRILHEDGVQIVMLTGDSRTTAEAVARTLGIDRVEAEMLPAQKAEMVKPPPDRGARCRDGRGRGQRRTSPGTGTRGGLPPGDPAPPCSVRERDATYQQVVAWPSRWRCRDAP